MSHDTAKVLQWVNRRKRLLDLIEAKVRPDDRMRRDARESVE